MKTSTLILLFWLPCRQPSELHLWTYICKISLLQTYTNSWQKTQDPWFEVFSVHVFFISIINFLQRHDSPLSHEFNFYFPLSQIHARKKNKLNWFENFKPKMSEPQCAYKRIQIILCNAALWLAFNRFGLLSLSLLVVLLHPYKTAINNTYMTCNFLFKTDYIFWYNTPMTNGSLSSPCKLYQGGRPAEKTKCWHTVTTLCQHRLQDVNKVMAQTQSLSMLSVLSHIKINTLLQ